MASPPAGSNLGFGHSFYSRALSMMIGVLCSKTPGKTAVITMQRGFFASRHGLSMAAGRLADQWRICLYHAKASIRDNRGRSAVVDTAMSYMRTSLR